jgi:hypothetical protein
VGIRCADHVTPSTRKSRYYFADSGGRSVSIVRLETKATEFGLVLVFIDEYFWCLNFQSEEIVFNFKTTILHSEYLETYPSIYCSTVLVDLGRFFNFLIYSHSIGLLGRGIIPSQGLYLHREQHKHRINDTDIRVCLEWDSNPRSQSSRGRRRFMPQTSRPV